MSKLFSTESGRALIGLNEEIGKWRWARKIIKLPPAAASAKADLWMSLARYEDNRQPLEVLLNGRRLALVKPDAGVPRGFAWVSLPVPAGRLRAGENVIELRAANTAMNGWIIAVESGHEQPASFLSTDRGATWRNHAMGAHGVLRGEYVMRVRSHAPKLQDPPPASIVYEDARHPRVRELLDVVPQTIRRQKDPWAQLLALRTWLAQYWRHDPRPGSYTPWDPETILDWSRRNWTHGRRGRVVMCVHYGVAMVGLAAALGHRSRCVCVTNGLATAEGHFMAEVWDPVLRQWVLHDPNFDVHYEDRGRPLATMDMADFIQSRGRSALSPKPAKGPGFPRGPRRLTVPFRNLFASGESFRLSSVWRRNDFISDPTAGPPNHGSIVYAETDFVWYAPPAIQDHETAPFPARTATRAYFDAPPER